MSVNYLNKFNINKIHKNNSIQTILIGSPKEKDDEYVIINILNGKRFLQKRFKDQVKLLHNLVHFEDIGEGIVFITKIAEEISLAEYMKHDIIDTKDRLNLACSYLEKIVNYDGFSNEIKDILVGETQLVVQNGNVLLNEVIIIEEDALIQQEYSFNQVAQTVGNVLAKVFYTKTSYNYHPSDFKDLSEFINNLINSTHNYKNLSDIYYDFEAVNNNIFNSLISAKGVPELEQQNNNYTNNTARKRQEKAKAKPYFSKKNIGLGLGLALILVASLWASMGSNLKKDGNELEMPGAYFEETDDVTVINKSIDLNSSDESKENDIPEDLEEFEIIYLTPELISMDKSIFRSGQYSLKFIKTKDKKAKSIFLNNVDVSEKSNNTLSLWIMSDNLETIKVDFEGYNNSTLVFYESIKYNLYATGSWEIINLDLPPQEITKIKMSLISSHNTVWIDELKIDIYK